MWKGLNFDELTLFFAQLTKHLLDLKYIVLTTRVAEHKIVLTGTAWTRR